MHRGAIACQLLFSMFEQVAKRATNQESYERARRRDSRYKRFPHFQLHHPLGQTRNVFGVVNQQDQLVMDGVELDCVRIE
jgi:hypothetical protein